MGLDVSAGIGTAWQSLYVQRGPALSDSMDSFPSRHDILRFALEMYLDQDLSKTD